MSLHPQIVLSLKALADANLPAMHTLTPVEARELMTAVTRARGAEGGPIARAEDRVAPGPAGDIPVRVYWPNEAGPLPIVVYFHGGGHVIGSLETHDAIARNVACESGALVVSVDYRMGPEHRFPAAVEDSWAAVLWAAGAAESLGADAGRIAVCGDSAGGNLAAVVALLARDAGGPAIRLQSLVYPVSDYNLQSDSYHAFAEGYGPLTRRAMEWFRSHYLNGPADAEDWRASPIKAASLAGVAPAHVITASHDVLRDDGVRYAAALQAAGVSVRHTEYAGMIHGFFGMIPAIDDAAAAHREVGAELRRAFAA